MLAAFAALDVRYLGNERRARDVYDQVADDNSVVPLSLKGLATKSGSSGKWYYPSRYATWSILYFYGPLALVGGVLLVVALLSGPAEKSGASNLCGERSSQQR
ncbi:hypothetical protein [Rhodococcus sovatensis]|uniref:Uncharacterized protein n=1 Tax=Rhodococcus sovatensis TaxID=1805840 RepID=A0ABZ2PTQ3_9NOCA